MIQCLAGFALRTHKIHQPELVLQHGAFGFWTLHHFAADIGDVWRVHSVDAKTVKGVQDKCVMPPTLFHDRRWQALWLLNIVDLGCKNLPRFSSGRGVFSRLQMIDTVDTIDTITNCPNPCLQSEPASCGIFSLTVCLRCQVGAKPTVGQRAVDCA